MLDQLEEFASGDRLSDSIAFELVSSLVKSDWIDAISLDEVEPPAANSDAIQLFRPASFDRGLSVESIESNDSVSTTSSDLSDTDFAAPRAATSKLGAAASKLPWTPEEDRLIAEGVALFGNKWSRIRKLLPPHTSDCRTEDSVRNRWQRLLKKQTRRVARAARAGRTCDAAVLVPGKDKAGDMWTAAEDDAIELGVKLHGLNFGAVVGALSGRTESGCRNRWLRNTEKRLAARGVSARGARGVFAALHATGELTERGEYHPFAAELEPRDERRASRTPTPPMPEVMPEGEGWTLSPLVGELVGAPTSAPLSPLPSPLLLPPPPPASPAMGVERAPTALTRKDGRYDYPWESCGSIRALRAASEGGMIALDM